MNTGICNTGDCNTGSHNTGDWNTGDYNTEDYNTGNSNTGYCNTGDCNTGSHNTGDCNTGDGNTGNSNAGDCNTGHCNTGHCNTGNWNAGDHNTGDFNTQVPDKIMFFNKWISFEDFQKIKLPDFLFFHLTEWIFKGDATLKEKKEHRNEIEATGGFLKVYEYKEAFQKAWDNAPEKEREQLKNLPGFDADVFYEISGIRVED